MFSTIFGGISELFTDVVPGWFSVPCFLKGVAEGLLIGIGTLLVIAALPAEIAVFVAVGLIALGVYGLVRLSQAWPHMTGDQKSEAVGQITGGIIAGGAGPKFIPPPAMTVPAFAMAQTASGEMVLVPVPLAVAPATAGTLTGTAASGMAMATTGGGGGGGDDEDETPKKRGTLDESERKLPPDERKIADKLCDEGHDVKAVPESSIPGDRSPDVLVDGTKDVEFKTFRPTTNATSETVKDRVGESLSGSGQARNIIINAEDSNLTEAQAQEGMDRVGGRYAGRIDSLRIFGKGYDITRNY